MNPFLAVALMWMAMQQKPEFIPIGDRGSSTAFGPNSDMVVQNAPVKVPPCTGGAPPAPCLVKEDCPTGYYCQFDAKGKVTFMGRLQPPEPMDVSAVMKTYASVTCDKPLGCKMNEGTRRKFKSPTCEDKTRVLLMSEDKKWHCIKFPK